MRLNPNGTEIRPTIIFGKTLIIVSGEWLLADTRELAAIIFAAWRN